MAFPGTPTRTGYQQTVAGTSWTAFTGVSIPDGSLALFVLALDGGTSATPTLSGLTGADTNWFPVTDKALSGIALSSQVFYWFNDTGAPVNKSLAFAYTQSELASGILLVIPRTTPGLALQVSGTGVFTSTSNPNPPLLDIGFTRDVKWITAVAVDSTVVPTVAPAGFSNLFTRTGVSTDSASAATAEQDLAGSSLDPGTFTSAAEQYVVWTLAVWEDPPSIKATRFNTYAAIARPSLASSRFNTYTAIARPSLASSRFNTYVVSVPSSSQTVTPDLFTNDQTFFAPTVTATYSLTPALFTNDQTFYSATVATTYSLTPTLFTNDQTFYSPAVATTYSLTPALFTNAQTFYGPTVTATYSLTPALFTNNQTFYSATVSQAGGTQNLTPALFTNEQIFFSPIVTQSGGTQTLLPGLFTNSNRFFSARVKICPPPPDWTPGPCPPEPNYTIVC